MEVNRHGEKRLPALEGRPREILAAARRLIGENRGVRPTQEEIAPAVGLKSASGVNYHWARLVADGYIFAPETAPNEQQQPRNYQILFDEDGRYVGPAPADAQKDAVSDDEGTRTLRIEGVIDAGPATEPLDGPSVIELRGLGESEGLFWLRVRGRSMELAGIHDGDLVRCRRQSSVEPGEIAVCLLGDGTATLKRVVRDDKAQSVKLIPAADGLEPVLVGDVQIQGRVLWVLHHV